MAVDLKTREPDITNATVVQGADAQSVDGAVALTFDVRAAGGGLERVRLLVPAKVARELALKLVRSAAAVSCALLLFSSSVNDASPPQQRAECTNALTPLSHQALSSHCG